MQFKLLEKCENCVERKWHIKKKIWYFFHVINVLEKVVLKMKLLRLHHDNFFANHLKIKKTYALMQRKLY